MGYRYTPSKECVNLLFCYINIEWKSLKPTCSSWNSWQETQPLSEAGGSTGEWRGKSKGVHVNFKSNMNWTVVRCGTGFLCLHNNGDWNLYCEEGITKYQTLPLENCSTQLRVTWQHGIKPVLRKSLRSLLIQHLGDVFLRGRIVTDIIVKVKAVTHKLDCTSGIRCHAD